MAPQSKRVLRKRTQAQTRVPTPDVQIVEPSCIHECTYGELWKSREFLDKQPEDSLRKALRVMLCYVRNSEKRSNVLKVQLAEKKAAGANDLIQHRRVGLEANIEHNGTLIQEFPELAGDILQEITARSVQVLNNADGVLVVTIDPAEILAMTIKHCTTMYHAGKHGEYQAGFNAGFEAGTVGDADTQTRINAVQQPAASQNTVPTAPNPPTVAQEAPPPLPTSTRITRASTAKRRQPPIDLTGDDAAEPGPSRAVKRVRIQEPATAAAPPPPPPPAQKPEIKAKAAEQTPEEAAKAADSAAIEARKEADETARKARTAGYTAMRAWDWVTACAVGLEGAKDALGEACRTHRRFEAESKETRRLLAEMGEGA